MAAFTSIIDDDSQSRTFTKGIQQLKLFDSKVSNVMQIKAPLQNAPRDVDRLQVPLKQNKRKAVGCNRRHCRQRETHTQKQ